MANNVSVKSPVSRAHKEYTKNLYNLDWSTDLQKGMKAPKMKTIWVNLKHFYFFHFLAIPHDMWESLVPWPGIKLAPTAVEAQILFFF